VTQPTAHAGDPFFRTSSRNLLAAEADAGTGHDIALSVVGTGRLLESGYFRAKLAQEELIKSSSIPYSIVHATQFFEFINRIADEATDGNTVRLPRSSSPWLPMTSRASSPGSPSGRR
jgi:uncharacterized protein YbjT (DUF2867 family)